VRTGILLGYAGGFAEAVDHVADLAVHLRNVG
jgi:hypothetical protein